MKSCIHDCVVEAGWRRRTLLRSRRFFSTAELILFFKSHVLSYIEYRTSGIYHAASSNLAELDRVLSGFLHQVGVSALDALLHFNLAPLSTRRDIAMLGFLHRVRLGFAPTALSELFPLDVSDLRRSVRQARHSHLFFVDTSGSQLCTFKRSVFGLTRIYNILPHRIVSQKTVKDFQHELQNAVKVRARLGFMQWDALFSPRLPVFNHPARLVD